uniref:Acetyl-CoA hydrolase n=1 Tax=Schistocephalus solidus TaxID=70667 RepID=A0A183SP64_SCHSO
LGKVHLNLQEPIAPVPGKYPVWSSHPSELFADLKDGIVGASASPTLLTNALYEYVMEKKLKNIRVYQHLPLGDLAYLRDDARGHFKLSTSYSSKNCRDAVNDGRADFIPIQMSELPLLYRNKHVEIEYALVMLSPPDKHGFCTLGSAIGSARSAIQNAKRIIGQINPLAPVTYGDSTVHISRLDFLFHGHQPLSEMPIPSANETEQKIAAIIADNLVDDGATIQLGFGRIPYEVTYRLRSHKDLGVHAEIIADGIIDLVNLGVITNRLKPVQRGRIVTSYCIGTQRVFDFVNENPQVSLNDIAWVNSTEIIAQNPKVTTVNTCFEMDLTGQSVADGIGETIYTGVGGQLDFTRAASVSEDGQGRPIITMCSKNSSGESSIVPVLRQGSAVVATRAHVHYVVTEYGIAYLFGKSLRQRAHALIQIAHPDFR